MGTDETELNEAKEYLTGGNGWLEAVFWLLGIGVGGVVVFLMPPSHFAYIHARLVVCGLIAIGALVRAGGAVLREWNAAVIVSEAGVTARNWRNVEKFISWDSIRAVRYSGGWYTTLSLEVLNDQGQQCREQVAFSYGYSESVMELAEAIVRRLGFDEVPNPPRGFFTLKYGPPDTVWR